MVVRGWKAWKKRMNLRYQGIFWRVRPIGNIERILGILNRRAKTITGNTWVNVMSLEVLLQVLS